MNEILNRIPRFLWDVPVANQPSPIHSAEAWNQIRDWMISIEKRLADLEKKDD